MKMALNVRMEYAIKLIDAEVLHVIAVPSVIMDFAILKLH